MRVSGMSTLPLMNTVLGIGLIIGGDLWLGEFLSPPAGSWRKSRLQATVSPVTCASFVGVWGARRRQGSGGGGVRVRFINVRQVSPYANTQDWSVSSRSRLQARSNQPRDRSLRNRIG